MKEERRRRISNAPPRSDAIWSEDGPRKLSPSSSHSMWRSEQRKGTSLPKYKGKKKKTGLGLRRRRWGGACFVRIAG